MLLRLSDTFLVEDHLPQSKSVNPSSSPTSSAKINSALQLAFSPELTLDTEPNPQASPFEAQPFRLFLPANRSRVRKEKAMAEPTAEEIETANRLIDDVFDQHPTNMEDVTLELNRHLRALNILQVFTSGTMKKYEDDLRLLLHGYDQKCQEKITSTPGLLWGDMYQNWVPEAAMDSAARLRARVGHRALPASNENYLLDLARFWRRYGGHGGPGHPMSWHFEDCWTFVSGRILSVV